MIPADPGSQPATKLGAALLLCWRPQRHACGGVPAATVRRWWLDCACACAALPKFFPVRQLSFLPPPLSSVLRVL